MDIDIGVEGMNEVNRALQRLNDSIPAGTQNIALLAAGITIDSAKPTIPKVTGKTYQSLQHYLTATGAVAEGGSTVEHYRWLELGGLSGRKLSNRRDVVTDGRYIYPGYVRKQAAIQDMMGVELGKLVGKSGLS